MATGELFSQLSLWWFKLCLTSCTFCLYLILYLHFTCVNPNPQSSWIRIQYGSGSRSTTLADNVLAVNSWGLCLVDNFLAMVITFWPPSICRESCRERPPLQIVHYDKIKHRTYFYCGWPSCLLLPDPRWQRQGRRPWPRPRPPPRGWHQSRAMSRRPPSPCRRRMRGRSATASAAAQQHPDG